MSGDHTQSMTTTGSAGHGSGHDVAHAGSHDTHAEHERPEDWGWHAEFGKWARIAGFLSAVVMLLMLIGNHQGRVEDLWLIGIAAIIFAMLGRDAMRRRKSWRN